ncbi:antiterminator Q family protein [Pasteurella canis]|uniref:Phage antitermination protein Q n=3 Tax=Pasteurella TaxID=745 RepID=A0ABQ4VIE2_9PAST|nr:antiterminator Q family protein [Pasteurella canis]UEC23821.1 antitermination protein [Pasteurella canis]GJH43090.1 hypothetical protein PA42_12640 [Pasteurella canis]SPY33234.1 Phage antitermination protein Q [Pasteurella canis]HDR1925714.1 antitermination protein [Pasteurella multocida]
MGDKLLEKPRKEWVQNHLDAWGAWAFNGLDFDGQTNIIAKLMLEANGNKNSKQDRKMCDDELGLVISSVIGHCIKTPSPEDYKYIEAKYIFNLSNYSIAQFQHAKDKSISFNAWYKRINQSIDSSEWIIAKFLDYALKNHKNADKLQKFAFNV